VTPLVGNFLEKRKTSMKKKLLSLLLTLAACLSLTIPALADGGCIFYMYTNGETGNIIASQSGEGWSYEESTSTLTLNGTKDVFFSVNVNTTIVLAPGSKNTLTRLEVDSLSGEKTKLTIKGSGELLIHDPNPDEYNQGKGVFGGYFMDDVSFQDGLKITGGNSADANSPLTLGAEVNERDADDPLPYREYNAQYIRIASAAGSSPAPASGTGFTDVAAASPYKDAIDWAVKEGITKGITNTTFGPSNTCTVSHILTFLWRANGQPGDSVTDWAKEQGIDAGDLSIPCTRAMAVEFMWKAAGSPAPSKTASFSDVPASAVYANAVSWAVEKGVTNGTSATTFAPDNTCTRGQIVTFLYRASK